MTAAKGMETPEDVAERCWHEGGREIIAAAIRERDAASLAREAVLREALSGLMAAMARCGCVNDEHTHYCHAARDAALKATKGQPAAPQEVGLRADVERLTAGIEKIVARRDKLDAEPQDDDEGDPEILAAYYRALRAITTGLRGALDAAPQEVKPAEVVTREVQYTGGLGNQQMLTEWHCADCDGWHTPALGGIRIGHPCPRTEPTPGQATGGAKRNAPQEMKPATSRVVEKGLVAAENQGRALAEAAFEAVKRREVDALLGAALRYSAAAIEAGADEKVAPPPAEIERCAAFLRWAADAADDICAQHRAATGSAHPGQATGGGR